MVWLATDHTVTRQTTYFFTPLYTSTYLNKDNSKAFNTGEFMVASFIGGIINITIGAVILASVFITTVKNQNTTGWATSEVAMWGLLSLVGIVGLVFGVLQVFGLA